MLFVVIPVYDESSQIQDVLNQLETVLNRLNTDYLIVMIDDGSSDESAGIIRRNQIHLPLVLLQHETNRGVSSAFRTGFDEVMNRAESGDRIVTMEANRNADPETIPQLIQKMDAGSDLVLASCYAPGGKVIGDPIMRYILSRSVNWILGMVFRCQEIHTFTSFYRLWTFELLAEIQKMTQGRYFDNEGFVCMADMLLKARLVKGVSLSEVPYVLVSDIREAGSKMKVGRTILGYLNLFCKNIFLRAKR
jgi:dolichol-phosphate mannosyltransferase